MVKSAFLVLLLLFVVKSVLSQEIDVYGMDENFFKNPKASNNSLWSHNNENHKIVNTKYKKGILIELNGKFVEHGVFYLFNSSGVKTDKIYYKFGKKDGLKESYYSTGETHFEIHYKDNVKDGKWIQLRKDKSFIQVKTYVAGKIHGKSITYRSDGSKEFETDFVNGQKHGYSLYPFKVKWTN